MRTYVEEPPWVQYPTPMVEDPRTGAGYFFHSHGPSRVSCLETSLFVIGGISAWYILRGRHVGFFLKSFRLAVALAVIITPLQIWLGDGSGKAVFAYQPAKGAALEGHWRTNPPGQSAPWALLAWPNQATQGNDWAVEIPDALSLLATGKLTGTVRGLKDFVPEDQPPLLPLIFYAFRAMAGIGFCFFFLMLCAYSG